MEEILDDFCAQNILSNEKTYSMTFIYFPAPWIQVFQLLGPYIAWNTNLSKSLHFAFIQQNTVPKDD